VAADLVEGEEICINYVAFIHGTFLRRQKLQASTDFTRTSYFKQKLGRPGPDISKKIWEARA